MAVKSVTFESGFIVVDTGDGPPTRWAIADVLRSADIPVLTIDRVVVLSRLAKLFAITLKTLITREVLDESFDEDYDLDFMIEVLEDELAIEDGYGT